MDGSEAPPPGAEATFAAIRAALAADGLSLPDIYDAADALAELAETPGHGLATHRLAVIGSTTTSLAARAAACAIAAEGLLPVVHEGLYGAWQQEVLDPASGLHGFAPQTVAILTDWRDSLSPLPLSAPAEAVAERIDARAAATERLWRSLARASGAKLIHHTIAPPPWGLAGPAERLAPASPARQIRALNDALLERGAGLVSWVEMDRLAEGAGVQSWADPRLFHSSKLSFAPQHLAAYMAAFRGAWRAAQARAKKVLVLDLDNTLWGGVIGDDGIEGIVLGPGTPAGEAFAEWGGYIRALAERGVILAVCSKNDPEIARAAFAHAGHALRLEDFAAFEASWADKAGGLRRIAAALNVGIESLVFADDNPAECALVRAELPEVGVVHLGDEPSDFIRRLEAGHWFAFGQFTAEDFQRTASYAARRQAAEQMADAADLDSYLAGLEMRGAIWRPGEGDIARVVQLEAKTNQFNLTTKRFGEPEIRGFLGAGDEHAR